MSKTYRVVVTLTTNDDETFFNNTSAHTLTIIDPATGGGVSIPILPNVPMTDEAIGQIEAYIGNAVMRQLSKTIKLR